MKDHYYDAKPVEVTCDLPHLREGDWKVGETRARVEYYLGQLEFLGMHPADAQCMISDLFWDCCAEMAANGMLK